MKSLKPEPELCWVEPAIQLQSSKGPTSKKKDKETGLGPTDGFIGITKVLPEFDRLPPAEVRLFWRDACLQVLLGSSDCRWVAFATKEGLLPSVPTEKNNRVAMLNGVIECCRPVVWRQDINRFLRRRNDGDAAAAQRATPSFEVRIREFRKGPRVAAWWLVAADPS